MTRRERLANAAGVARKVSAYNLKIIFANRFAYFMLAAFLFFLGVAAIIFFSSESDPGPASVYYLLILPGLLVIFYPTAFGIQNDVDARMIETLFGIPDYRYKVWLARVALIWVIVFAILVVLTVLSSLILVRVPILRMLYQLMFPIFFIGSLAFMFSTVVRSGNGTAVIIVVTGMGFWLASVPLSKSKWNLFLNPFAIPTDMSESIWAGIVFDNRVMIAVASVLAILAGLYNLQKREKFI
ncbi:MAG: hypothetical protein PHQ19_07670 [Candidatus Krumholzibacteria bacterium]|nr:hypothetical protein [Candidatus Krumholzibacteria bacterium]